MPYESSHSAAATLYLSSLALGRGVIPFGRRIQAEDPDLDT